MKDCISEMISCLSSSGSMTDICGDHSLIKGFISINCVKLTLNFIEPSPSVSMYLWDLKNGFISLLKYIAISGDANKVAVCFLSLVEKGF